MSAASRAEAVVLAWARRYTAVLPADVAQRRVQELASDCWEQRHRGREVGAPPLAVATSMVVRTLAGIPADLAWRHQVRVGLDGRPLHAGGRPMGRWIKDNWWVVLGGLMAALTTVLGIGLPFEDRTVGAAIGGTVIALLGLTGLVGVFVRRRPGRRGAGDLMIAVAQLPWLPFFWTVVPPIIALTVMVAAFIDLADAEGSGRDSVAAPRSGGTGTLVLLVLLVVATGAAVVAADPAFVLAVPTPVAVALLLHLALARPLGHAPAMRAAAVLVTTPLLWWFTIIGIGALEDGYAVHGAYDIVVEAGSIAMVVAGLGLAIHALVRRRPARPA